MRRRLNHPATGDGISSLSPQPHQSSVSLFSLAISLLLYSQSIFSVHAAVPQPSSPTYTFRSYYNNTQFREITPLYASMLYIVSYIPGPLVDKATGTPLNCGNVGPGDFGMTDCSITEVWQADRKTQKWEQIPALDAFALKSQSSLLHLMVDMVVLRPFAFTALGKARRQLLVDDGEEEDGDKDKVRHHHRQLNPLEHDDAIYTDPVAADNFTPFWPGTTPEQEQVEIQQSNQNIKRLKREEDALNAASACYDRWIIQNKVKLKKTKGKWTQKQYDLYTRYLNDPSRMPLVCRKLLLKEQLKDATSKKANRKKKGLLSSSKTKVKSASIASNTATIPTQGLNGEEASTENFMASAYIKDYAIIVDTPFNGRQRIDITVVPRIYFDAPKDKAYFCRPGDAGLETISKYLPEQRTCNTLGLTRPSPYVASGLTPDTLHPEESAWLPTRLAKTNTAINNFVFDKTKITLGNTDLKVAVIASGGGKRSTLNSFGVAKALYDLGIFNQSSYVAGLSGGGWFMSAWYAQMKNAGTTLLDPSSTFNSISANMPPAFFNDVFDANQYLSRFADNTTLAFKEGLSPLTRTITCEAQMKLQSPLTQSEKSASWLEYWTRSAASQFLAPEDRSGLKFSDFATAGFLAPGDVPMPLFQIQEQVDGHSGKKGPFRLWDISPFDISIVKASENLHYSFPTQLMGTRANDLLKAGGNANCTIKMDELSFIFGISSYAWAGFNPADLAFFNIDICGQETPGGGICQPILLQNPIQGVDQSTNPLYGSANIFVADGGINDNLPIWPLVNKARKADVIFTIDASADSVIYEPSYIFPCDDGCGIADSTYGVSTQSKCCDVCTGESLSQATKCWPTADPATNALFIMRNYDNGQTTLPPLPTKNNAKFVSQITFFGCDDVKTSTSIVYIPNRMVTSGRSGHQTFKGCSNPNTGFPKAYTADDINRIYLNGRAQVEKEDTFANCVACLYTAKAKNDNGYMQNNCKDCYSKFCWNGQ